jgi:signal transduction histidine kinase
MVWLGLLITLMYAQQFQPYYHIDYSVAQTIYFTIVVLILSFLIYYINVVFQQYIQTIMKQKKELKSLNENLANEVKKEIEKNRQKEQYLLQQSRFAQMGQMISMIAHQWRQPLNNISTTTNNLTIKLFDETIDKNEFEKELGLISNYTQYLSHTIDDFKDFFKADKPKEKLIFDDIIHNTLSIIEPSLKQENIKLELNLNCVHEITTHKNELIQVVLNIIKNAQDVLNERTTTNPTISIKSDFVDNSYILKISDNAGGIDEDIMDKIFDPYFSTKKGKNGTGLGLYISKIIIQEHCNGKINVEVSDEKTIFVIELNNL